MSRLLGALLIGLLGFPAPALSESCGFRAHKNLVSQTGFIVDEYNPLAWPAVKFNVGGYFNTTTGRWRPPAGLVLLSAHLWVLNPTSLGSAFPQNYVVKLLKNGQVSLDDTPAGICTATTYPDTAVCQLAGVIDKASGTDEYEIRLFVTNAGAVLEGNPSHTWWSGACLQ